MIDCVLQCFVVCRALFRSANRLFLVPQIWYFTANFEFSIHWKFHIQSSCPVHTEWLDYKEHDHCLYMIWILIKTMFLCEAFWWITNYSCHSCSPTAQGFISFNTSRLWWYKYVIIKAFPVYCYSCFWVRVRFFILMTKCV